MSFLDKTDFCGLEVENVLVVKSAEEGRTASVNEIPSGQGAIAAEHMYGEICSPNNEYVLCGDWNLNGIRLGAVTTVEGVNFALTEIKVNTSVGEPVVTASATQVGANDAGKGGEFAIPNVTITPSHEVKNLLGAFTIEGEGNYEQTANYTFTVAIGAHNKDGVPLAYGQSMGKIVCDLTIAQVGNVKPTVVPGEGWTITAPLSQSNADSSEPEYSCQLTYPLPRTSPTAAVSE